MIVRHAASFFLILLTVNGNNQVNGACSCVNVISEEDTSNECNCVESEQLSRFKFRPDEIKSRKQVLSEPEVGTHGLVVTPINTAVYTGDDAIFRCSAPYGSNARIQWWEWASSGNTQPQMISDRNMLVEHPWSSKYDIQIPSSDTYYLVVRSVQLSDVGRYTCVNAAGGPPCGTGNTANRASADLSVISGQPECYTTISSNGMAMEGDYFTAECLLHFQGTSAPSITWNGPSPYTVYQYSGDGFMWSGIELNAIRTMQNGVYTAVLDIQNIWEYMYTTPALDVYWGPQSVSFVPDMFYYNVGDVIICHADARPSASFTLLNVYTGEYFFNTDTFFVTETMYGKTQRVRCQAKNTIRGETYSADLYKDITVPGGFVTGMTTEQGPVFVTTEQPVCGNWHYDSNGYISSHNYPWGIPIYGLCTSYISLYRYAALTISFTSPFGMENCCEYLEIHTYPTGYDYQFTGSSIPSTFTIPDDYHYYIEIKHYSTSNIASYGWSFYYWEQNGMTTEQAPAFGTSEQPVCGNWHYDSNGYISSHNYPWGIPMYGSCTSYISLYRYVSLTISFNSPFGMDNCCETLEIRSYPSGNNYQFTGSNIPSTFTIPYDYHYYIEINHYSTSNIPSYGWSFNYWETFGTMTPPDSSVSSGGTGTPCGTWFYNSEGTITSQNFPWGYPVYPSCTYYINVYQYTQITITFNYPFGIHSGYVEFYSPSTGEQYTFNGFSTPYPIYFSYNYHYEIRITYYSNSGAPEEGFSVYYTVSSGTATQDVITEATMSWP